MKFSAPLFLLHASSFFSKSLAMQKTRVDGIGGKGITFIPANGEYKNVVVWMHGLGDTADGWASLMPNLGLTNTKFILPTAPNRPISFNGGSPMPGWSDIYGLEKTDHEDRNGFDNSAARINEIIQKELDNGVASSKIVIAGFSQGGALALHVSMRSTHKLGGCVALSTWLPLNADYPAAASDSAKTLPILQVHGDRDQVVAHQWGRSSHDLLKTIAHTPVPQFVTIQGMGHSSDEEETELVKSFLHGIFAK